MNLKNLPKIPFRILSFTSEDTNYPVTELLHQSPQSKGWQSQRCVWLTQVLRVSARDHS